MRFFRRNRQRRVRPLAVRRQGITQRFRRLFGLLPQGTDDSIPREYYDYLVEHILMRTEAHLRTIDEIAQQYLLSGEKFGNGREKENGCSEQLTQLQKREEQTW